MIPDIFETEPDFINEIGVKWWKDDYITNYAQREDQNGIKLNGVGFYIQETSGRKSRVFIMDGKIIAADQTLDGIGCKIDILKMLK